MERDEIIDLLKRSEVLIKFVKKDGTQREMWCTLKGDVVVPYEKKTDRVATVRDSNQISVWDIENNGWRSFLLDSVISVTEE